MKKNRRKKNNKIKHGFKMLEFLYSDIPATKGCMENLEECKSWCCFLQSCQLLYVEFLNAWKYICNNYSIDDILNLIELCVRNYVSNNPTKGCVLWNKDNKTCNIHKKRFFNCRIYGITPKEEFDKRYAKITEQYKDNPNAIFKNQCPLVKAVDENGKEIKVVQEEIDDWWLRLNQIEEYIGVDKELINDDIGGSYRTFHDHVLLHMMPDSIMIELEKVRLMEDKKAKDEVSKNLIKLIKENIEKNKKWNKKQE